MNETNSRPRFMTKIDASQLDMKVEELEGEGSSLSPETATTPPEP
jgi:hypothetical protein